ncbi:hypothetical protein DHEL01_v202491 [Diaporthe helianthi]|uniref:Uncharacterized protein n=1 Tax=Diaporthe helianthi TaxID=158607 RepID=A0A2P5I9F7_DIAHE|nr:hypothetical protein DHEL01_v202491 [Diaporthe helianthi]
MNQTAELRRYSLQPIRACPEDGWGPLQFTLSQHSTSIDRRSRSLQAQRMCPDPTLGPSECLSPALAVDNTHHSTSISSRSKPSTTSQLQQAQQAQQAVHCLLNLFSTSPIASEH